MTNQPPELIDDNFPDPAWDLWSDNLSEESQKAMDDELEARLIETCDPD